MGRKNLVLAVAVLVGISLLLIPVESHAWRGWHGRGWYGPGLFAGGVVLGAALARPWYAAPPPVYAYPPPAVVYSAPPAVYAAPAPAYAARLRCPRSGLCAPPAASGSGRRTSCTEQGAMGGCAGPDRERPLGARPQGLGT